MKRSSMTLFRLSIALSIGENRRNFIIIIINQVV